MENIRPKWSRVRYTREMLESAVTQSFSVYEVMRRLGIRLTGGSHAHIRRRITREGISTEHFTGRGHSRGTHPPNRLSPAEVLVVRRPDQRRQAGQRLRQALVELGTAHECSFCRNGPEWRGQPLTLHVDHINGDFADCRRENLRFLCPNCHSQTPTFAGKGKRKRPDSQSTDHA
ncbi:HNH endonuclease [Longispora albida]|uniref:HNH endonuclease signature motif containing protein n=1 Tax=Longispora albida TaxID=203523 RepID=UPI000A0615ED|nr:HNH endonuclease [Longispora albida]